MWDYPELVAQGRFMSEVFHGSKMLTDIPPDLVSSTVWVNNKIFYVDELLQRSSGANFIPERFFY
jgi:hypothetical protein